MYYNKLICIAFLLQNSYQQDISAITDIQTLSELPLEKLLKLKHTFDYEETEPDGTISAKLKIENGNPEALALQAKRKTHNNNRIGYESDGYKKKGDKKDSNSIFQMTVTALAFVSFGGYLLCLIVQAIRAKNNLDDNNGNTLAMFARPNRIRKQNKPPRRPRPSNGRYKRDVWPMANPQKMYDALLMLAEGYSKYHTVDYRHFNSSINVYSN